MIEMINKVKTVLLVVKISFVIIWIVALGFSMAMNAHSTVTNIYVDPETITKFVGQTFTINVSISNVVDLYAWELKLKWNATMLDMIDIDEGPFLKQGGDTFFTYKLNETEGSLLADCTLLGDVAGVNGNGTIVFIEFYVKAEGECPLDLYETTLVSSLEQPIEHTTADGYLHAIYGSFHNLAIREINPYKTVVGQGFPLYINVTIKNEGTFSETFNVSVYYNGIPIELPNGETYMTVSLEARSLITLTFEWNTTNIAKGNYTISSEISVVTNETDTDDNYLVDGFVIVAMVGDLTGADGWPDGKVDIRDIAMVASKFGVIYPDSEYNPNCDIIYDKKINIRDVVVVAVNFGKIDP